MSLIKLAIVALLFIILFNLFRALFLMVRPKPGAPPMSRYLGRRVALSGVVILLLLLAMATGLIEPNPRPY